MQPAARAVFCTHNHLTLTAPRPVQTKQQHPPPPNTRKPKLDAGKLVCAGAAGDPVEGAVFLFKGADRDAIEAFVAADPYVKAGLVTAWCVIN